MDLTRPQILDAALEPAQATLRLRVPPEANFFKGHFPQRPILPGVVQLSWAALLGQEYLQAGRELLRLEAIKFSRIVQPGAVMSLQLRWRVDRHELSFHYTQDLQPCSSGRFTFTA